MVRWLFRRPYVAKSHQVIVLLGLFVATVLCDTAVITGLFSEVASYQLTKTDGLIFASDIEVHGDGRGHSHTVRIDYAFTVDGNQSRGHPFHFGGSIHGQRAL